MTKPAIIALLFVMACSAFLATTAKAALIITLTEAPDGGVDLKAMGTSAGNVGAGDNTAEFRFEFGMVPESFNSLPPTGGSLEVAGNPYTIVDVVINAFPDTFEGPAATVIAFNTNDNVTPAGLATVDNVMATFPVGNLAFTDLTPGTYAGTDVAGVSLVIVPEPASLARLVLGGVTLLRSRCSHR